jgi:hypothetical protein
VAALDLILRPVIDLAPFVGDRRVVANGVGDEDQLVVLLGSVTPGTPVHPSEPFIPGGEHDPTVVVSSALLADRQSKSVIDLPIEPLTLAFPVVQPLSDGGLLVADSRVAVGKPPNGHVIGSDGKLRGSIMFGDGIEHMLVDRLGRAWVGYFDEGVFGNLGWGHPDTRHRLEVQDCSASPSRMERSTGRSSRLKEATSSPTATPSTSTATTLG